MRLIESPLRCFECGKETTTEEAETITRHGKRYWICPNCDMENPIVDKVFPPEGATAYKKEMKE